MEPTQMPQPEVSQPTQPEGKNKYSSSLFEFFKIIIIAAIIVLPIRYFIFQPFIVKGESMEPTFHSGDYLIVDEISYRVSEPKRGDVVVFKYPLDVSQKFIKRIIGLPGETVEINDGKVTISKNGDNTMLNEVKYLPDSLFTPGERSWTLKDGEYFVMGDNRQYSYDSRSWGVLPKSDIIGRAIFRLFPISNISYIQATSY